MILEGDDEIGFLLSRPVEGWCWLSSSFLSQHYSEWYGAVRPTDGKTAAVRVIVVNGVHGGGKSLVREMKRLSKLDCPGLSRPVDYGIDDYGAMLTRAWYALECELPMRTLEDHAHAGVGPQEALALLESLGQSITKAHSVGLVLRPEPAAIVMVTGRPTIMLNSAEILLHSGISLLRDSTPGPRAFPAEETRYQFTPAGDQFRLGVIAYFLMAGRWPFEGEGYMSVLGDQGKGPPPDPREFAPHLPWAALLVLQRALAKDPGQRFPSVDAMVVALRLAMAGL